MFVARGEDDGAGVVAEEALGDTSMAEVGGGGVSLLEHRVGADHLDDESVAAGPWLQLVHLGEHRLPLGRLGPFVAVLLRRRRH